MYEFNAAAAAKSHQLCPTLCGPRDGSPPGSSIPGIFQARLLSGLPCPSPIYKCNNDLKKYEKLISSFSGYIFPFTDQALFLYMRDIKVEMEIWNYHDPSVLSQGGLMAKLFKSFISQSLDVVCPCADSATEDP